MNVYYGKSKQCGNLWILINKLDFEIKTGDRRAGDKEISEVPFVSHYMTQNYSLDDLVRQSVL